MLDESLKDELDESKVFADQAESFRKDQFSCRIIQSFVKNRFSGSLQATLANLLPNSGSLMLNSGTV
jgi:hypothetical protein